MDDPSPAAAAVTGGRIDDPSKRRTAMVAWAAPIIGLAATIAFNCAGGPREDLSRVITGLSIFGVCILIGIAVTILNWTRARRYRGVMGHAVAGTITNVVIVALVSVVVAGAMSLGKAARTAQEMGQLRDVYTAIASYARDTGTYPQTYESLVGRGYLDPRSLVMPAHRRPAQFKEWSAEEQTQWALERLVFHFPVMGRAPAETTGWSVMGYMPADANEPARRYYVVRADGDVAVVARESLTKALSRQNLDLDVSPGVGDRP